MGRRPKPFIFCAVRQTHRRQLSPSPTLRWAGGFGASTFRKSKVSGSGEGWDFSPRILSQLDKLGEHGTE
jgi:hypothetical protein